ncbi:MAG: GNAT family N-acetyltransferase [Pseudomonadota bacterium]
MTEIRPASLQDHAWILPLNKTHEHLLSPLDAAGLTDLIAASWVTLVRPPRSGFVACFEQDGDYDSPNFLWFRERFPKFVYVDRIAVDAEAGVRGTGSALYEAVFAMARAQGYPIVCCEVNTVPVNQGSLDFHAKKGFETVGEAHLPDRGKTVRYLLRRFDAPDAAGPT